MNLENTFKKGFYSKINLREYGVIIGFVVLCAAISIASPEFLAKQNILNLLRQSSIIGVIATGMTFVIISGNFDVSVGAIAAFSGAIAARLLGTGQNLIVALTVPLMVGCAIGCINGILVAKISIPSLIATMAMVTIVKGSILIFTGGYPITASGNSFAFIGNGYFIGVPVPVLIFFAGILAAFIILIKTRFGRRVYSVGGNSEASRLSGINIDFYKISVFIINGYMAALAGIILCSRVGVATPDAGANYDLDAIASVVIGGTSIQGGEGSVLRTIIGVLLMSVISNGFNLLGVNMYFQYIIRGLIILAAVGFDSYSKKRIK
jgi:Ribose/xylose/arabinose/galactoside ABC-type transport systems, permease components